MRLLSKLIARRDAAYAEYQKWQSFVDLLQTDPEFLGNKHAAALKAMNDVKAMADLALGASSNGHSEAPKKKPNPTTKYFWTKARRAAQAKRMAAHWKDPKLRKKMLTNLKAARGNARPS